MRQLKITKSITNRESQSLEKYLQEIGKVDLLTPEEEVELAERIKKGDKRARSHMIRANLRLVVKIAQDYSGYGLPLADLISEGNIGLMKAVKRFNPYREVRLASFAVYWIRAEIHEFILKNWKIA